MLKLLYDILHILRHILMKVTFAVNDRLLGIIVELKSKRVILEADQAIYSKIMDAMFRMADGGLMMFDKTIPRM